ncbi:MAG: phosphoribosyl-AMP cyclohydrolase [Gammaproteobacteria bacterium]
MESFLDEINWNSEGLAPVITQDAASGRVLMQAWLNREALATAIKEQQAVYWSRSRGKLWRKGEQSGNTQELVEILLDCDNDALCYRVNQNGVACHTGRESCFFRRLEHGQWIVTDDVIVDPKSMYQ